MDGHVAWKMGEKMIKETEKFNGEMTWGKVARKIVRMKRDKESKMKK